MSFDIKPSSTKLPFTPIPSAVGRHSVASRTPAIRAALVVTIVVDRNRQLFRFLR